MSRNSNAKPNKVAVKVTEVINRAWPQVQATATARHFSASRNDLSTVVVKLDASSDCAISVRCSDAVHPRDVAEEVGVTIGAMLAFKRYTYKNNKGVKPRKCKINAKMRTDILQYIDEVCGTFMYNPAERGFRRAYATGQGAYVDIVAEFPYLTFETILPYSPDVGTEFSGIKFVKYIEDYINTTNLSTVRLEAPVNEALEHLAAGVTSTMLESANSDTLYSKLAFRALDDSFSGKPLEFFTQMLYRFLGDTTVDTRFPTGYRLDRDNLDGKGKKDKLCNTNACQSDNDVTHLNNGTRKYYCIRCADDIDRANFRNNLFERRPGGHNFG